MEKRGRYRTKQQELILDCLKGQGGRLLTVEQFMDCLQARGVQVGKTTVYRGLERLAESGDIMRLPDGDGLGVRYCYTEREKSGNLVCQRCGRLIPLECAKLDGLFDHICQEHGFALDRQRTVLYGCCQECREKEEQE